MVAPASQPGLTLWLVDTRTIWQGKNITEAAATVLPLLPPKDQAEVKRKYQIQDARMSLASALLKRLYISQTLSIPWSEVAIARRGDPTHGKPAALLPDGSFANIDFNVSHQGGLVALIGYAPTDGSGKRSIGTSDPQVKVGVDITLVNERNDYRTIDADGFDGWTEMFADVFSEEERWDMTYSVDYVTMLDGTTVSAMDIGRWDRCLKRGEQVKLSIPADARNRDDEINKREVSFDSELIIEAKLRRFYAFFAYKEAYIKLAGEALLAPWLKELEFQNVRSPLPGVSPKCSGNGVWGERVDDVETLLHGKKVEDIQVDLRAFDENFMISTAIEGDLQCRLDEANYKILGIMTDILPYAQPQLSS